MVRLCARGGGARSGLWSFDFWTHTQPVVETKWLRQDRMGLGTSIGVSDQTCLLRRTRLSLHTHTHTHTHGQHMNQGPRD